MNHAIVLAMLPLPLLAWASWPQEQSVEIVARTVQSEGIRAQRQDTETFTARWRPVYLAPMRNEVRARSTDGRTGGEASSSADRGDGSMFAPAIAYHTEPVPVETVSVRPQPPPARLVRRAALRGVNGICARHGMRTVHYGKRWRCKK